MMTWSRNIPFETSAAQSEIWRYDDGKDSEEINVEVRLGKPIDILSLKWDNLERFRKKIKDISSSRRKLYAHESLDPVKTCPVCDYKTAQNNVLIEIYGAQYTRCPQCMHHFVRARPSKQALEEFYAHNQDYQKTYADPKTLERRMQDISLPKAEWVCEEYQRVFDRKPVSLLDVGAGSGHFVHACRQMGLVADGVEISASGRKFCKENFGFELIDKDFCKEWESFTKYEVICFWGVIEHVPNPREMLTAAHHILSSQKGLVVAEVPRWSCFGTEVQSIYTDTIVRHLDPLGHIQLFTDSSLATIFRRSGWNVSGAWYFGMDMYELLMQATLELNSPEVIEKLGPHLGALQKDLDLSRRVDTMVFAGTARTSLKT